MRNILALIFALFISSCSTSPESLFKQTAVKTKTALQQRYVWAEILEYTYKNSQTNKLFKKEIIIFKYPNISQYIYSYNRDGSFRLFDFYGDKRINYPLELAQQSEKARKNYFHLVQFAEFVTK